MSSGVLLASAGLVCVGAGSFGCCALAVTLLLADFVEVFLVADFFTAAILLAAFFAAVFFFTPVVLPRVLRAVVLATFLLVAGFFVFPAEVSTVAVLTVVPLMVILPGPVNSKLRRNHS